MEQDRVDVRQREHDLEMMRLLLRFGANVNICNNRCQMSLTFTCILCHAEAAGLLLEARADANQRDEIRRTPPHFAAGWTEVTALLRGAGASARPLDDDGNTAGILAVLSGCTEIARLLL